ncbi:MAG: ABC transporter substrate-binding protein [Hyphomicrobiales bacterium]|nr:MAG: ABC transporter substrate-binding protein [Hyphomicrobiales bacterium]
MRLQLLAAALAASISAPAFATDIEVTHWWTSGGEAAAVKVFADSFNALGGDKWVDGAIAGGGGTARPVIISRIIGGEPMGATQLNHGRQAEELVEAGLMLDLTELATKEGWRDVIHPVSLLDSCTVDGKIYCVPINIHSWQWIWLSHKAYKDAGVEVPKNWNEFVAAAPALEKVGIIPLAMGQQSWQTSGAFDVLLTGLGGTDLWRKVYADKDAKAAASDEMKRVFEAFGAARKLSKGSTVQDWNQATNMVITGKAGGQIMGDWAQGEFQVANQVAGVDYTCLPGLGIQEVIGTGGDAFYFPKNDDPEITKAQLKMASMMLTKEVQVNFNLKKGSLPVRGDVDLSAANDCMKKGLAILASGNILPDTNQVLTPDTTGQKNDLMVEFWNNLKITPADAQARFVKIIEDAE